MQEQSGEERFPVVDCIESAKEGLMFNPNTHHHQGAADAQHMQQAQQQPQQHAPDEKTLPDFPFCYNASMLQKGQAQQPTGNGIETNCNDKTSYRFDVTQPFTYNYALVNQMSLAAAASTVTFKCEVCGVVFGHLSLLNHHKRIHMNEAQTEMEIFTCEMCNASFNQACDLKAHKDTAHKFKACNSTNTEPECEHKVETVKKKKFPKCKNCGPKMYENTQDASTCTDDNIAETTQTKGTYPVKKKKVATVAKCEKCNGTGIIFIGNVEPEVDKPFHCNVCDSSFARYSSLWSHRRLHSGDKPFKCELCGVTFARAAYLKNHNKVHTGERPFKCNVCGMQFTQSAHLKNHERIHSGERPYECDFCGKNFARHSTLWNHRRIHTGEKPYECEICGTCFNQASHLRNHAKVHTGEKPHKCDICDVGFSDKFALKRHRGIHEKYGQTGPNQPARAPGSVNSVNSNQDTWKQQNQTPTHTQANTQTPQPQMDNSMYKCDSTNIKPTQVTQQTQIDNMYKCNVPGSIAFPGCSRPPEK